jgi:hypothetical protein
MDEKMLILLGLGAIGYLAATNLNNDDDDDCHENHHRINYDERFVNPSPPHEQYFPTSGVSNNNPVVSYQNYPTIDGSNNSNVSPLSYGQMVQENYVQSDYIKENDIDKNPNQIPVYDEKSGNVGLPVSDMTDMSVTEKSKYVYNRTIGAIGFTSTKIGGRRRGQADYIRGDLAIVPDRSSWFQTTANPSESLMKGALRNENALSGGRSPINRRGGRGGRSSTAGSSAGGSTRRRGAMQAMRTVERDGQVLGECDDEKPDYMDCIYDSYKKQGLQPTFEELMEYDRLQKETYAKRNGGLGQAMNTL